MSRAYLIDDFCRWTMGFVWTMFSIVLFPIFHSQALQVVCICLAILWVFLHLYRIYWNYKHNVHGMAILGCPSRPPGSKHAKKAEGASSKRPSKSQSMHPLIPPNSEKPSKSSTAHEVEVANQPQHLGYSPLRMRRGSRQLPRALGNIGSDSSSFPSSSETPPSVVHEHAARDEQPVHIDIPRTFNIQGRIFSPIPFERRLSRLLPYGDEQKLNYDHTRI